MTLPYPHGIETGRLKPIDAAAPDPLKIEHRVRRLVVPEDTHVDVAGRRLRVVGGRSAEAEAERVRGLIAQRLLERRPNADEATWQRFDETLRVALSRYEELDEAALAQALELIDGL